MSTSTTDTNAEQSAAGSAQARERVLAELHDHIRAGRLAYSVRAVREKRDERLLSLLTFLRSQPNHDRRQ